MDFRNAKENNSLLAPLAVQRDKQTIWVQVTHTELQCVLDAGIPSALGPRALNCCSCGHDDRTATYYALHVLIPRASSSVTTQIIAFEVYVLLIVALGVASTQCKRHLSDGASLLFEI